MTTFAGLLSKGAVLSYKEGSTSKEIAAVKSIPAMGADPEKVDVTHLGSEKKAYISGIQDTDNMEFAIIYQGDNFKDIDTLVKAGKSVDWTVTYSDGLKVEFTGEPSYKFDGVEVNQALGFNLVVVVSAGPDFTRYHLPVNPQEPTGVTLDKTSASVEVGKTVKLVATVVPENAENKTVTWTSSDETKATVEKGTVTAVSEGEVTITVKTVNNKTATSTITVTAASGN